MSITNRITCKWFLTGAVAFGFAGYVPSLVQLAFAKDRHDEDYERTVSIDALSHDVRRSVQAEAHDQEITLIQQVRKGNHEFFRVIIHERGHDQRLARFGMDGRLLSEEEAGDAGWVPPHVEVREEVREKRNIIRPEEITSGVDHPQIVDFRNLPGRARALMGREAEGEPLNQVVGYRNNGNVVFQANVPDPDGGHGIRVIQVTYDGHLVGEASVGAAGVQILDSKLSDIPPAARDTILHEADGARIDKVTIETRHGHSTFSTDWAARQGNRWITVGADGRILSDVTE